MCCQAAQPAMPAGFVIDHPLTPLSVRKGLCIISVHLTQLHEPGGGVLGQFASYEWRAGQDQLSFGQRKWILAGVERTG